MKTLMTAVLAGALLSATGCEKKTPPPVASAAQPETNQPAAAPAPAPKPVQSPSKKLPVVP